MRITTTCAVFALLRLLTAWGSQAIEEEIHYCCWDHYNACSYNWQCKCNCLGFVFPPMLPGNGNCNVWDRLTTDDQRRRCDQQLKRCDQQLKKSAVQFHAKKRELDELKLGELGEQLGELKLGELGELGELAKQLGELKLGELEIEEHVELAKRKLAKLKLGEHGKLAKLKLGEHGKLAKLKLGEHGKLAKHGKLGEHGKLAKHVELAKQLAKQGKLAKQLAKQLERKRELCNLQQRHFVWHWTKLVVESYLRLGNWKDYEDYEDYEGHLRVERRRLRNYWIEEGIKVFKGGSVKVFKGGSTKMCRGSTKMRRGSTKMRNISWKSKSDISAAATLGASVLLFSSFAILMHMWILHRHRKARCKT